MVNFPMRKILCDSIYSNTATYFLMAKFSQIVYHINIYYPKKSQDKPMRINGVLFEVCHIMIVCHMTLHDGIVVLVLNLLICYIHLNK